MSGIRLSFRGWPFSRHWFILQVFQGKTISCHCKPHNSFLLIGEMSTKNGPQVSRDSTSKKMAWLRYRITALFFVHHTVSLLWMLRHILFLLKTFFKSKQWYPECFRQELAVVASWHQEISAEKIWMTSQPNFWCEKPMEMEVCRIGLYHQPTWDFFLEMVQDGQRSKERLISIFLNLVVFRIPTFVAGWKIEDCSIFPSQQWKVPAMLDCWRVQHFLLESLAPSNFQLSFLFVYRRVRFCHKSSCSVHNSRCPVF